MDLEKIFESPLDCEEIQPVHPKRNRSRIFIGRTEAEADTPILWPPDMKNWLWKKPWCGERLRAGREDGNRGWDGWLASLTQWTWVWVSSRSWWWTGKASMLQSMGWQRAGHNWATELNWTELYKQYEILFSFMKSISTQEETEPKKGLQRICTLLLPFLVN